MEKFMSINDEDKKEWEEIIIKIPKNTVAIIVNTLVRENDGAIAMGNLQFDSKQLEECKKYNLESEVN